MELKANMRLHTYHGSLGKLVNRGKRAMGLLQWPVGVCGKLKSRTRCFSSCVSCNFSFVFSFFMLRKVKVCANVWGEECAARSA